MAHDYWNTGGDMATEAPARVEDLTCPFCGSGRILMVRGEIHGEECFQEYTCTECQGDFLVSYGVLRKQ